MDFPTPKSIKQLRSIIGILAFLGRYIKNFAEQVAILTPLILKREDLSLAQSNQEALDQLKQSVHKDIFCNMQILISKYTFFPTVGENAVGGYFVP